ncbi:MAG: response regulator [Bacteroidales bacterium]|nr:response regulator [Bacteroidales bacterium]
MAEGKLLIVDDNKSVLSALKLLLQNEFKCIETISNPNVLPGLLKTGGFDVVLLDMNFSAGVNTGNEGLFWLAEIKKIDPAIEVVMFTAYGDIDLAVKATRIGAADFILKPWDNDKMIATLRTAFKLRFSNLEVKKAENQRTEHD